MSLEEVYTEGPMPNCVRCGSSGSVCRIVQYRPPYSSPLHSLRGSGAKTGLVSLVHRGVAVLPSTWPCVDAAESKCTHHCKDCNVSFRKPATIVPPDPPQVIRRLTLLVRLPFSRMSRYSLSPVPQTYPHPMDRRTAWFPAFEKGALPPRTPLTKTQPQHETKPVANVDDAFQRFTERPWRPPVDSMAPEAYVPKASVAVVAPRSGSNTARVLK